MLLNVLELLMIVVYVLVRCAATVAICYFVLTYYGLGVGKFWLCAIAVAVGLGFSLEYENPNNKCSVEKAAATTNTDQLDSNHGKEQETAKEVRP